MVIRQVVLMSMLLVFSAGSVTARETNRIVDADTVPLPPAGMDDQRVFDKVEVEARFPGGDAAWRDFLVKNLNAETPVLHKAPAGIYTVVIQFVVDREGRVSDIKAITSHGYGMEEEVIRLLKKAPRWEPAFQDGRHVKAFRKQPVTFQVVEEKKKRKNKDKGD
ncbi:MAG TPA: energy transducer TonB [Chitinophagaceae bacterium]|nr:energy transducer TonB [Chitinophagaceae bacterium]